MGINPTNKHQAEPFTMCDRALDLLRHEAAVLTVALARVDEQLAQASARQMLARAAEHAARAASARLVTMTQTPYVAAVDAATLKAQWAARRR